MGVWIVHGCEVQEAVEGVGYAKRRYRELRLRDEMV